MLIKDARKIHRLMAGMGDKKFPVKVSYAVQKNSKEIQELISFAEERQNEIIGNYTKKDENGIALHGKDKDGNEDKNTVQIDESRMQEFVHEMNDLENTDIDVNFTFISLDDLSRCDEDVYDYLSPNDMEVFSVMMKED